MGQELLQKRNKTMTITLTTIIIVAVVLIVFMIGFFTRAKKEPWEEELTDTAKKFLSSHGCATVEDYVYFRKRHRSVISFLESENLYSKYKMYSNGEIDTFSKWVTAYYKYGDETVSMHQRQKEREQQKETERDLRVLKAAEKMGYVLCHKSKITPEKEFIFQTLEMSDETFQKRLDLIQRQKKENT
jgi:hypothetical protein